MTLTDSVIRRIPLVLTLAFIMSCAGTEPLAPSAEVTPAPVAAAISGTAMYRERMALPPDAVFEAVLEDVSLADAAAVEIARMTIQGPSAPPIRFSIPFDAAKIDSKRSYSVRARIRVDGKLWFASDSAYPVLTRGAGTTADILLRRVSADSPTAHHASNLMGGQMTYLADAARFTDCASDASVPIAMEGDFIRMQQAYRESVREPGAALYVTFEGSLANRPKMEGAGLEQNAIVGRFIRGWPNQNCERSRVDAPLMNTHWRIVSLGGQPVAPIDGGREPRLLLRSVDEGESYAATVGCNQMSGGLTLAGESIRFSSGITTLMGCPPPLDVLERSLGQALTATQRWQIKGNTLELLNAEGAQTALFDAVHL
jgi:uncharacterized lipoprotein YbaY/heat shock protein HslJ